MTSRQRLIDRVEKSAASPSANNDLLEEVEISQSFSPPTSQNEFTTISGATSSHTFEEPSAAHDDLVVSVITTHSSSHATNTHGGLVPPSSLSQRRSSRKPEFFDTAALELPTCSPTYYDCILSHVGSDDAHNNTDNDSTTSSGYFETTDFLESTWASVVNESNMHYNLGMLALATTAVIVVHPLVLFAGAGVAAASFWAVGVFGDALNLEYFSDASFQQLFWKDAPLAPKQEQILVDTAKEEVTIIDEKESNSTSLSMGSEETPRAVLPPPNKREPLVVPSLMDARIKSDITQQGSERILRHFPPLENEIVSQVEFPGMDAAQFFNVFFADDCPFTFKEFQKKRGDIDISYGKWGPPDEAPASLHNQATGPLFAEEVMQQRTLKFKTLTKSYFGPAFASAIKTQRVTRKRHLVILESRTRLEGIPFCDRFQVVERWIVETPRKRHYSVLKVFSEVQFKSTCSFEGQIRKKSLTTVTEVVTSWCEMAKEAIERTAAQKKGEEDIANDDIIDNETVSTTNDDLFEQHEEKLKRVEESILNGGLDSIEVQHCLSPSIAKIVNDEKPQEGIVVVTKKKSRIVALAGKVTTVSPKRSRSSLRGFGNSVRSRFMRKSSAPIHASSSSDV